MAKDKKRIKEKLLSAISKAETHFSGAKYSLKDNLNLLEPVKIIPYHGFGNEKYVFIKGRVLEKEKVKTKEDDVSTFKHLRNTLKRYETDEIPDIRVKATFADVEMEMTTDKEGFFQFEFHFDEPVDYEKYGKEVKLKLLESITDNDQKEASAQIFVPDKEAEFGVISDIDDTVLVSRITEFFKKLKLMLMKDASERSPFPGIAAFLRALSKGRDNEGRNALFYVSGSEWNIYDLLLNFFRYHDIPEGPLLLRDKGSKGEYAADRDQYKKEEIRKILKAYPNFKFICIGDSGQQDAEIYQYLVEEFPSRILGIYIRDVTPDARDKEVRKIAEKVKENGSEMILVQNTLEAAHHALKMDWINQNHLEEIEKDSQRDREGQ